MCIEMKSQQNSMAPGSPFYVGQGMHDLLSRGHACSFLQTLEVNKPVCVVFLFSGLLAPMPAIYCKLLMAFFFQ